MILNDQQLKEILEIIERFHNSFVYNNISQDLPDTIVEDLKKRGLIDPLADNDQFMKHAYELSRLKHLTEGLKDPIRNLDQLKRHLMTNPVPMTDFEVAAIEHLTSTAKQYLQKHASWLKTAVDESVRNQNMALRHDLVGGNIKNAIARGVAERKGISQIVSTVRKLSPDTYRDFHRIVQTELQNAINVGQVDNIMSRNRDKKSDQILVYKRPNPDACQYCKAAYLMPDGQTPRIFTMSELLANGTNYGRKARDWKPVYETMHPWCQCRLYQLQPGWGFQNGTLHFFGPNFDSTKLIEKAQEERHSLMKRLYDASGNLKKASCECCDSDVLAKAEMGERVQGATYVRREGSPGHYKYFYNDDFKTRVSGQKKLIDKIREAVKLHMEHHKNEKISHDELHDIVGQLLEHKHMESKTPISVLVAQIKKDVEGAEKKGRGRPKKKGPEDYINAKPSEVSNIGEDVLGAARHNYSTYTLAELESNGMAEKAITKKYMLSAWDDSFSNTPKEDKTKHLAKMYIHQLMPSKPKNTPEAREEYSEVTRAIQRIDDQSTDSDTFLTALADYFKYKTEPSEKGKVVAMGGYKWINDFDTVKDFAIQSTWSGKRSRFAVNGYQMFKRAQHEDTASRFSEMSTGDERIKNMMDAIKEGPQSYFAFATQTERRKAPSIPKYEEYIEHNVSRKGGRVVRGNVKEMTNKFEKDLNCRAVQFGNSVTDDEREYHMKHTLESFYDLADITGLDINDVSINGRLAMAFGARGKSGALAHYEPAAQIINLTRASGVGSLAHEWGHFLDNILQLQKEGPEGKSTSRFLSEAQGGTMRNVKDLPIEEKKRLFETLQHGDKIQFVQGHRKGDPVIGTFRYEPQAEKNYPFVHEKTGRRYNIHSARSLVAVESKQSGDPIVDKVKEISMLMKDGLTKQMDDWVGTMKDKKNPIQLTPYYYQVTEMFARSFETWASDKLKSMDRENTYLVAQRKMESRGGAESIYPQGELRRGLNKHFDELFEIIKKNNALKKAAELLS